MINYPLWRHTITKDQFNQHFSRKIDNEYPLVQNSGQKAFSIASDLPQVPCQIRVSDIYQNPPVFLGYMPFVPIKIRSTDSASVMPRVNIEDGYISSVQYGIWIRSDLTANHTLVGFLAQRVEAGTTLAQMYSSGLIDFSTFENFDVNTDVFDLFEFHYLLVILGGRYGVTNPSVVVDGITYEFPAINAILRSDDPTQYVVTGPWLKQNTSDLDPGSTYSNAELHNYAMLMDPMLPGNVAFHDAVGALLFSEVQTIIATDPEDPPVPSDIESRVEALEGDVETIESVIGEYSSGLTIEQRLAALESATPIHGDLSVFTTL